MSNGYYSEEQCSLSDLEALATDTLQSKRVPYSSSIEKNIPLYDASSLSLSSNATRREIMAEWAYVLQQSAGVFIVKNAITDLDAIDKATHIFESIIREEKAASGAKADHFAGKGNNDRIWNALQKLCINSPATHIRYFASPAIDAACEAWLGPNYQMTAQVNVVHPGGVAQQAHRDYHLGFQSADVSASYPAHVHELSPLLTLQGGIAHCDIPIESGPTKVLPFTQKYKAGYAAWRREDFRDYFEKHFVQLPLNKGDAMFFNPALFHAAGSNNTKDTHRMVNLLQVSSAFGRTMETINRQNMCNAIYTELASFYREGKIDNLSLNAITAATAEGYSFPTNLDFDPPVGGLAPKTQRALLEESIKAEASHEEFNNVMQEQLQRQQGY